MIFDFHYSTEKERKELAIILRKECTKHFADNCQIEFDKESTKSDKQTFNVCHFHSVEIPNDVYFADLQRAKESIYKQNRENEWHDLRKTPEDLPLVNSEELYDNNKWKWYLIKTDLTNHASCQNSICTRVACDWGYGDEIRWMGDDNMYIPDEKVFAWKEIESNEILLHDFISDVEENLSFNSKRNVR